MASNAHLPKGFASPLPVLCAVAVSAPSTPSTKPVSSLAGFNVPLPKKPVGSSVSSAVATVATGTAVKADAKEKPLPPKQSSWEVSNIGTVSGRVTRFRAETDLSATCSSSTFFTHVYFADDKTAFEIDGPSRLIPLDNTPLHPSFAMRTLEVTGCCKTARLYRQQRSQINPKGLPGLLCAYASANECGLSPCVLVFLGEFKIRAVYHTPVEKLVMPRLPRVFGGPASHSVLRGRLSGAFLAPKGACYAMEFIDAHYRFKVATSGLLCMHSRAGALKPVGLSSFVWIRVTGSLADADLFCALDEKTPSTKPCEFVLCAGRLTSAMASLHESDPIVPLILILKDDLHVDVTPLA